MGSKRDDVVAHSAAVGEDLASLAAFQELLLERSHDLITVMDTTGTIVYGSPAWQSLGWDPRQLVGMPVLDLVHPDDVEPSSQAIGRVVAGAVAATTVRLRTSSGTWAWYESTGSPILGKDGRTAYLLGTARDVSEREELRSRVVEVDALYRIADAISRATTLDELLAEAIDVVLEATRADRASVLLLDEAHAMRFRAWRGLSPEYRAATEGHSPWTAGMVDPEPVLVPELAGAGFPVALERAVLAEGISALAFVPLVHRGRLLGTFMLYHDRPHVWNDAEVKLSRTIANHLASATVRTQAQEALRASSDQLSTIMRTVDEGIVMQSQTNDLVFANEAAARFVGFATIAEFLGASREQVLAQFEILDEERRPLPPEELPGRRALRGETAERVVCYRILASGAERWSVVRANPVYDAEGAVALSVSVIRDITAAKHAEERLRFLARASELLNETLDYELTLAAIAEMAVPTFAGQVVIDLLEDDGSAAVISSRSAVLRNSQGTNRHRRRRRTCRASRPCYRLAVAGPRHRTNSRGRCAGRAGANRDASRKPKRHALLAISPISPRDGGEGGSRRPRRSKLPAAYRPGPLGGPSSTVVVRRRLPVKYPGPAHEDQKIVERTTPMIPTISKIQPTVWMLTPFTSLVTAKARTAPTAARSIPTPKPISFSFCRCCRQGRPPVFPGGSRE